MANFEIVDWSDGDITTEKLDQLNENDQFLYDNTPDIHYEFDSIVKVEDIKIWAGYVVLPASGNSSTRKEVYFPNGFFSNGATPIINAQLIARSYARLFLDLRGLGGKTHPNHQGFVAEAHFPDSETGSRFNESVVLHCQAIGY